MTEWKRITRYEDLQPGDRQGSPTSMDGPYDIDTAGLLAPLVPGVTVAERNETVGGFMVRMANRTAFPFAAFTWWREMTPEPQRPPSEPWFEVDYADVEIDDVVADECPPEAPYPRDLVLVVGLFDSGAEHPCPIAYAPASAASDNLARVIGADADARFWRQRHLYFGKEDGSAVFLNALTNQGHYARITFDEFGMTATDYSVTPEAALQLAEFIVSYYGEGS